MKPNSGQFDFLKKRWHLYLAALLAILGLYYCSRNLYGEYEEECRLSYNYEFQLFHALRYEARQK